VPLASSDGAGSPKEWNFVKARRNNCETCRALVAALTEYDNAPEILEMDDLVGLIEFNDELNAWTIDVHKKPYECSNDELATVCLVHKAPRPNVSRGIGRSVDARQINIDLLREWVQTCDKDHAGHCHTFSDPWASIERSSDLRFIDVENECLVRQRDVPGSPPYVALSYVWGTDSNPLQTLRNNVEALSQLYAFRNKELAPPLTIRDSMEIISSLGLKYLWVDRFCIVQDDEETKGAQLAAMASIYANAYFTIAACDGTAGSGLAGSKPERHREPPYGCFQFSQTCQMQLMQPMEYLSRAEVRKYDTRGWTFQEWMLSRRILVFHDQTVSWKCKTRVQQENGTVPLPEVVHHQRNESDLIRGDIWTSWPNIRSYLENVTGYSGRDLTDGSDKLKAFAAMMQVQGRPMKGRMLYGIPELFFSETLLWAPSPGHSKCIRSVDKSIPTWSWAAWVGTIDTSLATFAANYLVPGPGSDKLLRATRFDRITIYLGRCLTNKRNMPILKDLHFWNEHPALVETWSSNRLLPDGYRFSPSVPLVNYGEITPIEPLQQCSLHISFSTHQVHAWMLEKSPEGHTMSSLGEKDSDTRPFLRNSHDKIVGYMDIDFEHVPLKYHGQNEAAKLTLICIGGLEFEWNFKVAGNVRGARYLHAACVPNCFKHRHLCKLGLNWRYKFYNVLWVEWEDGVAYRKGIGKIWAHCWEDLGPQQIDVVLG
jgi:hypothetical protein